MERPYAVVDIDGVVADVRHRLHHIERRPKDWRAFFAAAAADPVLPDGVLLAQRLAVRHDVVWLSGRPEHLRRPTERWLRSAGLEAPRLLLRRRGDFRPAPVTKVEVLHELAGDDCGQPHGSVTDGLVVPDGRVEHPLHRAAHDHGDGDDGG